MHPTSTASVSTRAIHEDAPLAGVEVAAPISLTTTFRHPDPETDGVEPGYAADWDPSNPSRDVYARETKPTTTRAEHVLSAVIGQPTLLYPSGIAAFWAILLHVRPDVIAITGGYGGCHAAIDIYRRTRGEDQVTLIGRDDQYPTGKKLLVWLETPLNPTGESFSIAHYAERAHQAGGILGLDATFAPPPLQDPFKWGTDVVMHSATKYLAGHSDLLAGTVSVRSQDDWKKLWEDRTFTGANLGSLDVWLLLRSLRTLNVRVRRQARTGTQLAQWLSTLVGVEGSVVEHVHHTSLQSNADELLGDGKQLLDGPACFSFLLKSKEHAAKLPNRLNLFIHATSLGGVESLIEHRIISDPSSDPRLLRVSIGLEAFEDLKADLEQAFKVVSAECEQQ
ncbi:hypothetical protein Rhopal_007844-T1 [Rhodotorula paludigena]|uniref:Cystathionine gamma-synthase n=1 Tax=Rhodotorula paludigena TaxID=86838 RepID=A0AAV5GZF6_9BASI|nr:hypothetical protein Rhopal_007844-T1 [Rhodotorula paludigena]